MGRVKDFYHDEICNREQDYGPEPSDLEMLQMDYERALDRYLEALRKVEGSNVKSV